MLHNVFWSKKYEKIVIIFLSICFVIVVLSLFAFFKAISPNRFTSDLTPANFNIPYEKVNFKTQDGLNLTGWFISAKVKHAKTIILLHGYPFDKSNILPMNIFLSEKYNLLFFDFRSFGESEGSYTTLGYNEVLDVLAAIKYLKSRGINKVGIIGFSLGGAAALMAAPKAPEIEAMVIFESYARLDWLANNHFNIPVIRYIFGNLERLWALLFLKLNVAEVSPVEAAKQLRIPMLLIYSKQDILIPFYHFEALQKALENNPHIQTEIMQFGHHGQLPKNYQMLISNFFNTYLVSQPE